MLKESLVVVAMVASGPLAAASTNVCRSSALPSQRKDADTIKRLEQAWLTAEYRGDVNFLNCLLDRRYSVIVVKKGVTRTKADLIERVAKNKGGAIRVPSLTTSVAINGEFAQAYSSMTGTKESGEPYSASYVDFYRFTNGTWTALGGVDL